jgi:hypothetical protein
VSGTVTQISFEQVFLLIDEGTVRRYKADLTDEIEPQINELLERAEKGIKVLLRKESLLQTKVGLLTYINMNFIKVNPGRGGTSSTIKTCAGPDRNIGIQ